MADLPLLTTISVIHSKTRGPGFWENFTDSKTFLQQLLAILKSVLDAEDSAY